MDAALCPGSAHRVLKAAMASIVKQNADGLLVLRAIDINGRVNLNGELDVAALSEAIAMSLKAEFPGI